MGLAVPTVFDRGTEIRDGALIGHRDGKEYRIQDEPSILETFANLWSQFDGSAAGIQKLTDASLGSGRTGGAKTCASSPACRRLSEGYVESILNRGMRATLQQVG